VFTAQIVFAVLRLCLPCCWRARFARRSIVRPCWNRKDTSGASIPNATDYLAEHRDRPGTRRQERPGGNYTIPNWQVGSYQLTVRRVRFKTATVTGLELQVAQMASANVVLEVGQNVRVHECYREAPLMNTVSSTVSQMVDTKAVENMHSTDALSGSSPSSSGGGLPARRSEHRRKRRIDPAWP